jgi:hypothetical protein
VNTRCRRTGGTGWRSTVHERAIVEETAVGKMRSVQCRVLRGKC